MTETLDTVLRTCQVVATVGILGLICREIAIQTAGILDDLKADR